LYIFGLDASTGSLNYTCNNSNANTNINGVTVDALGNVIIYDPEYNAVTNPVYYQSPNIIIPNPSNNDNPQQNTVYNPPPPNSGSSSPAYQS
jgi:hypothetical protein